MFSFAFSNASSKMLSSAKASSARSESALVTSLSVGASLPRSLSRSRSSSLFGCRVRKSAYVASCSVQPVRSSAARDSARVNPYAPSRASIARCRSATCGSSRAAVPAKAARSSAAASLSSHVVCLVWSRAVAAAASRASSTRAWACLSEAPSGPSATARTRKLSGISSRGAKTQSQSTHSANRDSVAALRAFVTRFRLCTGVKVSSLSSSARNASKSNAPSRSGHRAAASSAHFFSKPALVRRRTIPSRRSALSRAARAFSSRRSASLAARAPSVTACASCAAS